MVVMTEQGLRSVRQAASALGLSPRAVLHRITKGEIAAVKIGDGRTSAYVVSEDEIARVLREDERAAS